MADDKQAESAPAKPATEVESKAEKKELAALKKRVAELEEENKSLEGKLQTAKTDGGVIVMKPGARLSYDGFAYEIVDIDTAWEIGQKVEKSFIEEDALAFVVRKL